MKLLAVCAGCYVENPIQECENWRGWEYDKRQEIAWGLCEDCKDIFNLYDGVKSIEDMIKESEGEKGC